MTSLPWSLDNARRKVCRQARELGYLVGRDECDGVVTITLLSLDPRHPKVHVIEIVPEDRRAEPFTLGERVVTAGVAVPHRVTPREVQQVLDLLVDIETTIP